MAYRQMTVKDWIAVPDNPIQRDTERHAARAHHLRTPQKTHRIVYAAELPNGSLVKLDGHTRALLWKRNEVRQPPHVEVTVIPVESLDEAIDLYKTIDTKEALETVNDKVSGAFRHLHFAPKSALLQRGSIANALRMCWATLIGRKVQTSISEATDGRAFDLYRAIEEFSNELFALDHFAGSTIGGKGNPGGGSHMPGGIIAAFILTYRKHGDTILPFWTAYFGAGGVKMGGRMDGVQALTECVISRKGKHGGTATNDLCARAIMAAEKWLRDDDFMSIPRPYDTTGYVKGVAPKTRLIKAIQSEGDHDEHGHLPAPAEHEHGNGKGHRPL